MMIEINLLPGKKKKKAPGAGFRLALPDFGGLLAQIKNPWLIAAVAVGVVVLGGGAALWLYDLNRLRVLDNQLEEVRNEKRKWDRVIAKYRQQEKVRDSLVAEIGIIRGIDADRYVWPHVLDQITKALPPYTWLVDIAPAGGGTAVAGGQVSQVAPDSAGVPMVRVAITGRTVDIQAYTTFLRQLTNSPWLTDVTPAQSQTRIESDRPVTEFNLTVRYRIADSLYIRTVPLTQAVR